MEFNEVITTRYSVRKFQTRPLGREMVLRVLEAARAAPTAVNRQPWRILAIAGEREMEKLAQCTRYTFGALAALIVGFLPEKAWVRSYDGHNAGIVDASIVATSLMLAIHNLGLGTCWVGSFDPQKLLELFEPGFEPAAILPIGWPDEHSTPSAKHFERLPLHETVTWKGEWE